MNLKETATRIAARLSKKYRVVVVDQESLSTARSWRMRPWGMLAVAAGSVAGVAILTLLLAKIAGFGKGGPASASDAEYQTILAQVDSLKHKVQAQASFIETIQKSTGVPPRGNDSIAMANLHEGSQGNYEAIEREHNQVRNNPTPQPAPVSPEAAHSVTSQPPADLGRLNLMKPVDGIETQGFDHQGHEEQHFGIDLVADDNSIIRAVADGVVIFSEYSGQTGYVIGVMHPQYNLVSFYKHNSRVFKTTGSYVFAGEAIAVIGRSGKNQSGTHLHFELWYNGNPINPRDYILF